MEIKIPAHVNYALETLRLAGCESFVVGGCVRDALMGKEPADWDICTSATPDQIKAAFCGYRTIDTGLKHGTVAVITENGILEITTYRIDGQYLDSRHPESVTFTNDLREDLARRDFTMNAIAYSSKGGIADPFGGQADIKAMRIRCVGEAAKRFKEDALRILRGLRFASVLGFQIDEQAAEAMAVCALLIPKVSAERIQAELSKLLLGGHADFVLQEFGQILKTAAPGLTGAAVSAAPENLALRLSLVFPENTSACLHNLKYDNHTIKTADALARLWKEPEPGDTIEIKKLLKSEGEEVARLYFETKGRLQELEEVLQSGACYSLRQLAVSGKDLIGAGVMPGPAVGEALEGLLDLVIEEKAVNEKAELLRIWDAK